MPRLEFDVNRPLLKDFDDAVKRGGLSSRGEGLKQMLALFIKALETAEQNGDIGARNKEGETQVVLMPPLEFARRRSRLERGKQQKGK